MRRRLVVVFLAVSTMVALAFVVPLAFLVRSTAEDRAIDSARADAAAVVPALVVSGATDQLTSAVGATDSGRAGRMTVVTPDGTVLGDAVASVRLDAALASGASSVGAVDGGVEVVAAVASGTSGELAAVRVFVPRSELDRGTVRAWTALGVVAVLLVGISVLVADRLARSVVQPTRRLAAAARRLGSGELDAGVEPEGPAELVELAGAFNRLGEQVGAMLQRERELVAELSHRLRTPLTRLQMRVDQVGDRPLAAELRGDVDDLNAALTGLIAEVRDEAPVPSHSDAARVVAERARFWAVLAGDQDRRFTIEAPDVSLWVAVAPGDLTAVVDVLLDNVFSHTPEGSAVWVGVGRVADGVRLTVEDDGPGFAVEAAERGRSGSGSSGLGLDIARRTALEAGGSMEIGGGRRLGGGAVAVTFPSVAL